MESKGETMTTNPWNTIDGIWKHKDLPDPVGNIAAAFLSLYKWYNTSLWPIHDEYTKVSSFYAIPFENSLCPKTSFNIFMFPRFLDALRACPNKVSLLAVAVSTRSLSTHKSLINDWFF